MKINTASDAPAYIYYSNLLQRFARRILKNEGVAAQLVKNVLQDQYEIDELKSSHKLRLLLKTDLINHCHYWQQAQIFDRPPLKAPSCKDAHSPIKKNKMTKPSSNILFL